MAQPVIQHAFNTGEWAPALNARVDLQKYHRGAATMRNFYVDYRGGASTRTGTKFVAEVGLPGFAVRLIPFQASFEISYVIEFGNGYIRFVSNGNLVLEKALPITAATTTNPLTVTATGAGSPYTLPDGTVVPAYQAGDNIIITGVQGMTQLNGRNFFVGGVAGDVLTLFTPDTQTNVDATGYTPFTSGGTTQRIYKLASPYLSSELALIKYAQIVNQLILCHPNHPPMMLTLILATKWTLTGITFGSTVGVPTGVAVATTSAGTVHYAYVVTSVDSNGQESSPSSPYATVSAADMHTTQLTNTVTWTPPVQTSAFPGVPVSYNVYKANESYAGAVPLGSQFGFIGNATSTTFIDSGTPPNFELSPPVIATAAGSISLVNITAPGSYTVVPTMTVPPPASGTQAVFQPWLSISLAAGAPTVAGGAGGSVNGGYVVGQAVNFPIPGSTIPVTLVVASAVVIGGISYVTAWNAVNYPGASAGQTFANPPPNPIQGHAGFSNQFAYANVVWGVGGANITVAGSGYVVGAPPAVTFTPAGATATAVVSGGTSGGVDPLSLGNPTVPTFFQQRLYLAAPPQGVQTFFGSQPGSFFNFNVSNPIQADDAIEGSIVSNTLNTIRSMAAMPTGLMMLCDRQAFLLDGGSAGSPVTPIDAVAHSEAYNGVSDIPPLLVNYDILYVQSKGSIVRDLTFNFYTQIYTGTDISVLSSHLFFGKQIKEWAWAEEPYKVAWAVRTDGIMLSLTFLKEQEVVGWARHDTNGNYMSVCSVTEAANAGPTMGTVDVDATYVVVQRFINGMWNQFIERIADRFILGAAVNTWAVDCALQYTGNPATTITGLWHLVGQTVTGLADGKVIPPQVVSAQGTITLSTPASVVVLGLGYTCQLQTLRLDTGDPTIQSKRKKIPAVTVRVEDALGLTIGKTFSAGSQVSMKDLVVGNVGTMSNGVVTDLVTGDARTVLDPSFDVPGQYCIQQSQPLPATVLGVMPEVDLGDTPK